jgi:Sec7-like guanine-nucleotide exchange factor
MSQAQLHDVERRKAQNIFDNADDEVDSNSAGGWLGEAGYDRGNVRTAFMALFDWSNQEILDALRGLCDRIVLKGETQQVDRVLDAFAKRWCECNPAHNFRSSGTFYFSCLEAKTDAT